MSQFNVILEFFSLGWSKFCHWCLRGSCWASPRSAFVPQQRACPPVAFSLYVSLSLSEFLLHELPHRMKGWWLFYLTSCNPKCRWDTDWEPLSFTMTLSQWGMSQWHSSFTMTSMSLCWRLSVDMLPRSVPPFPDMTQTSLLFSDFSQVNKKSHSS